ncbi:MAG: radical SAM protein [Candidatus Omnitrophica bacterium]|jgi:MoaA/NifB/PqqE/SkfB family radical SAM enzyme|nr:radical SAM protein [Candidatus Omnitrophota bacterium]
MGNLKQYGFYDYLRSEFPSQIIVENTELCNYSCIHCPHHIFEKSSKYRGRNLDLSLHKKLIDEIASAGKGYCQYIRYAALGETLLQSNFIEMIEYAGKYSGALLNITTNGLLLTEKKAYSLLNAGVNTFDVSIDAYSEKVYRKIRKNGDLIKVRNNCLKLIKIIKRGKYKAKMIVSFVEQPFNHKEKNKFVKFWKNAGANFVVIRPMHSASGSIKEIAQKIRKNAQKRTPCIYPWERLVLNPRGLVSYCPAEWGYQGCFADLRKTTIKKIWQGSFMERLRKAHLENNFSKFPFCRQCPDWRLVIWPGRGRNYSEMMEKIVKK